MRIISIISFTMSISISRNRLLFSYAKMIKISISII